MIVVLDTNILGAIVNPKPKSPSVKAVILWAAQMRQAGNTFAIPAIAVYELRRELIRAGATESQSKLDTFIAATTNIYLPLTDTALYRAAHLWATVRNAGQTTANDAALDGDVILMAQVLEANYPTPGYVVATDNLKHFAGFVVADNWQNIAP